MPSACKPQDERTVVRIRDLLTSYDVINGKIENEVGNPLGEICLQLKRMLKDKHGELLRRIDYFEVKSPCVAETWPIDAHSVACYALPGCSEGYYVHVDVHGGSLINRTLLLAKAWTWEDALELSNIVTRAMHE